MAAPVYINASTGQYDAGAAWTTNAGTVVDDGALVILQILQDGATAAAVTTSGFSDILAIDGTASSMTYLGKFACGSPTAAYQHLWIGRVSGASKTPGASGGNTTSEDLYMRWYWFTDVNAGTALADVIENSTAGNAVNGVGSTAAVADTGVTTLGPDRLALNFVAVDDDNALGAFTGMTGGTWAEAVAEYADATGTDGAIQLQTSLVYSLAQTLTTGGPGGYNLGWSAGNMWVAQSFDTVGAISVNGIAIYIDPTFVGTPTDDFTLELRSDSAGKPGSIISSVTVTQASLGTGQGWRTFALTGSLSAATKYWIAATRGTLDASNYRHWYGTSDVISSNGTSASTNGSTGWSTVDPNDLAYMIFTGSNTIDGGSYTMAAADNWGVVSFALKPVPPPVVYQKAGAGVLV